MFLNSLVHVARLMRDEDMFQ